MKIAPQSKLVFIGDSITDCERARPIGEGLFGAVGKGYVSLVEGPLYAIHPEAAIRTVNMGLSGNTVLDLKARWQTGCPQSQARLACSSLIGINDVWRQFDMPWQKEIHVLPDVYARTLDELVTITKPKVKHLVLMSPFYIEPNPADAMRARMDEYGAMREKDRCQAQSPLRGHAGRLQRRAATHARQQSRLGSRASQQPIGHAIIARAFLNAVGVPV